MDFRLALNLLDSALADGGGTFYADGDEFTRNGFVVGGQAPTLEIDQLVSDPQRVMRWIEANPSRMYGSWLDDGIIYIDAVDVFDLVEDAIEMGRIRGEKAIYDMAAGKDIRLDEDV